MNGKPIASHNAVLLAHGDAGNFNADFMAGMHSPQSLPVYLASHAIDVWGIDHGWALAPAGENQFHFYAYQCAWEYKLPTPNNNVGADGMASLIAHELPE